MRTDNTTDSTYRKLFYDIYQCKNSAGLDEQRRILDDVLSTWKGEPYQWNHLSFAISEREFGLISDLKPYAVNLLEHSNSALAALRDAALEHPERDLRLISVQIHLNLIVAKLQIGFISSGCVIIDKGGENRGQLQPLCVHDLLDQCWNIQSRLGRALSVINQENNDELKSQLLNFFYHSHHHSEHTREKDQAYFASYEQTPTNWLAWEFQHIDREFSVVLEACLKLAYANDSIELCDHFSDFLIKRRYVYRDTETVNALQKYRFRSLISHSSSSDEERLNRFQNEIQAQKMKLDYMGICQTVPKKNNSRDPKYSRALRQFILLYRDLSIFLSMTDNKVSKEKIITMKQCMHVIKASHMSWAKIEFYNLLLTRMLLTYALDKMLSKPDRGMEINDYCATILSALLQKMIISSAELCTSSAMANIPLSIENLTFSEHFSGVIHQFCQRFNPEYSAFFSIVTRSILRWLESTMFSIHAELKAPDEMKRINDSSLKKIADFYLKLSVSENPKLVHLQSALIDSYCEIIKIFSSEKHSHFSGLMPISVNLFWQYFTKTSNRARTQQGAKGLSAILESKHRTLDECCKKNLVLLEAPKAPSKPSAPVDDDALIAELTAAPKKKVGLKAKPSKSKSSKKKTKKKKRSVKNAIIESEATSDLPESALAPCSKIEEPECDAPEPFPQRELPVKDKNARRVLYYLQTQVEKDGRGKPFIYGGYVRDTLFQELHNVDIDSNDVDICVDLDTQSLGLCLQAGLTKMQATACIAMGPDDKIYGFKVKFKGCTDVDVSSLRETREKQIEVALLDKVSTFNFAPNRFFYSPMDKILYDLTGATKAIEKKSFPFLDQYNESRLTPEGGLPENLYQAMDLISKCNFFGLKLELDDRAIFLMKLSDLRNRFEYLRLNNQAELNKQRIKVYKPFRKLFCRGYALQAFISCQEYDCFTFLFPSLAILMQNPNFSDHLKSCCEQVDKTYQDKPELKLAHDYLSVSYLLALFFHHALIQIHQFENLKESTKIEVYSCAFLGHRKIPFLISNMIWDSKANSATFFAQARSWFELAHEETQKNPNGDIWMPPAP
jgi:tRNA nucleotidyltransferase/poly(A) polymerase